MNPDRRSPRATFLDYADGEYFVTICTAGREHFFGEISDNEMHLTKIGEVCRDTLDELSTYYPYIQVPMYVIMPDHVHAIMIVNTEPVGRDQPIRVPQKRTPLSVAVGGLKQTVTMYARRNNIPFGWQSRYYDRMIRNQKECNLICEYIDGNIAEWDARQYYGDHRPPESPIGRIHW